MLWGWNDHVEAECISPIYSKAHYKIAGQDIEYIWGISKLQFRKICASLILQQRVEMLTENVLKCLHAITIDLYWKCCHQTCEYKLAYQTFAQEKQSDNSNNDSDEVECYRELKLDKIEKMKKKYQK